MPSESSPASANETSPVGNEPVATVASADDAHMTAQSKSGDASQNSAMVPEFEEVTERVVARLDSNPDRLHEVRVPVWAELGRVEMLIGELLQLGEGSVVRLDRSVGDPVDLISQGVKLARGEVIVVDDCFAIRIRDIVSGKQ